MRRNGLLSDATEGTRELWRRKSSGESWAKTIGKPDVQMEISSCYAILQNMPMMADGVFRIKNKIVK